MDKLNVCIEASKSTSKILLAKAEDASKTFLENKNPRDILTTADLEAEKVIKSYITKYFPNDGFLAEESGITNSKSDTFWIIDPLDGTVNFFRGSKNYCSMVAYVSNKEVKASAIYFPETDELFSAYLGGGASYNGNKLSVSSVNTLEASYASTHMTSKIGNREINIKITDYLLKKIMNVQVIGYCIGRALAEVAQGITDFHYKYGFNYWDYTAGALLVEEAGGYSTDFNGNELNENSENVLVSNNLLHNNILETLNKNLNI